MDGGRQEDGSKLPCKPRLLSQWEGETACLGGGRVDSWDQEGRPGPGLHVLLSYQIDIRTSRAIKAVAVVLSHTPLTGKNCLCLPPATTMAVPGS